MRQKITFAFGSVPKDGGTYTFYRNMRPALREFGIDMRCVTIGKEQANLVEESYIDDGCVLLASNTRNIKKQAMAFAEWCEVEGVDIVMGINSEAILSSLPHLPEKIRVLSRCANAFDHGYRITLVCYERLAAIVAITPRLENDLINLYGAEKSKLHLIPNGVSAETFDLGANSKRGKNQLLQLGFLGRLEHVQKGVFYLPKIIQELNKLGVSFHLTIAGKGKHRSVIEHEMQQEIKQGQVNFIGAIPATQVPSFLNTTDILLFTSHFEGCPNVLLEAMMAGCVPVSWLIEGITDYIINDGDTGFICTLGNSRQFAEKIAILDKDRERLQAMSIGAAKDARERFTNQRAALVYSKLFRKLMLEPPPKWNPKSWDDFKPDVNFKHSWRELIPNSIKKYIKRVIVSPGLN